MVTRGIAPLRRDAASDSRGGENGLSGLFREMLVEMAERLRLLDERIREYDLRVARVFGQDERCQRLAQVEGVGPLVATALVAAVGNAHEFKSGRELSAWLGLVPRQHSSGGRNVRFCWNQQARRPLFAYTAHSRGALGGARRRATKGSAQRFDKPAQSAASGPNVAAVALANRNARVMWALLTRGEDYRTRAAQRLDVAQRAERRGEKRADYLPKIAQAVSEMMANRSDRQSSKPESRRGPTRPPI